MLFTQVLFEVFTSIKEESRRHSGVKEKAICLLIQPKEKDRIPLFKHEGHSINIYKQSTKPILDNSASEISKVTPKHNLRNKDFFGKGKEA